MANYLKEGAPAPKFSLLNQNHDEINLYDFIGKKKVLIYFYPKALTPGCTTQACGLRDTKEQFDDHNLVIFGISPDEPEKLQKFIEKHQLNFDLLSDVKLDVAHAFGVWGKKQFMGKEYDGIHRISFLIGLDGNIESVIDKFKTKDHHEVVLEKLS
jgi:thioredoxin-dependent peroxiredoxin